MLNDNDRLMTAFFVAILMHGVLILGVSFEADDFNYVGNEQLEVVLINGTSDELEPENANYYAQANQQGSGNTEEQVRASSTPSQNDLINNLGLKDQQSVRETELVADEAMRQYLAARKSDKRSVLIQVKPEVAVANKRMQARLMMVGEQILAPQDEKLNRNQISANNERELVVSINAKEINLANYIGAWRNKVERIGSLNYPRELLQKNRKRSPVVEVSISRSGAIRSAKILRTSGSASTDQAALRILRLAAPYDPFPEELAVGNDVLTFAYEWHFSEDGHVKGRALLDK